MGRDLIREYLSYVQVERGLSPNSLAAYRRDLRKLLGWAESLGKTVGELSAGEVAQWVRSLGKAGLSARSVAREMSAARGFYRFLLLDGHIERDPISELEMPRITPSLPRFLDEEAVGRLLSAPDVSTDVGLRDRALIEMLYATGLRVSELLALAVADVDVCAGLVRARGKGEKERLVPIGRSALVWLDRYASSVRTRLCGGRAAPNLFVSRGGGRLTRAAVWSILKRYARGAGLDGVTPHALRHSFATHMLQRGADSRSVQALLGHSDLGTTQIYTHITGRRLRATYDAHHPRARGVESACAEGADGEE